MDADRERYHCLADTADHLRDLRRNADADRVGERDFARLRIGRSLRHLDDAPNRNLALEGAAERGRDGDLAAAPRLLRQRDDLHRRGERFVRTLPLVADAEAVARHADRPPFVDQPGREPTLGAAPIAAAAETG